MTTNRHETHDRYSNLRLIEAVVGRREWDDDDGWPGAIVSRYPSEAEAAYDADRLAAQGLRAQLISGPDERRGYLFVVVGERDDS